MPVTIVIDGVEEAVDEFGLLATLDVLVPPMHRSLLRIENRMKEYPPQRPTTYRRTGDLGRAWTTEPPIRSGDTLEGRVGNKMDEYGPFVQSEEFQAWMHRGHWQTDAQVTEELEPVIVADFEQTIVSAFG